MSRAVQRVRMAESKTEGLEEDIQWMGIGYCEEPQTAPVGGNWRDVGEACGLPWLHKKLQLIWQQTASSHDLAQ